MQYALKHLERDVVVAVYHIRAIEPLNAANGDVVQPAIEPTDETAGDGLGGSYILFEPLRSLYRLRSLFGAHVSCVLV